jgi:Icc-related predicted phosphoesterase
MLKGLFKKTEKSRGTRIFFATDVHGSDDCFKKFLTAPKFYDADVLILGGDIIGKSLVPITKAANGYSAIYREREFSDLGSSGVAELTKEIRRSGDYFVVGERGELEALSDPEVLDRTFRSVVYASIEEWVSLAEERLRGTGVRCYVAPGNDDFLEIDTALEGGENVVFAERRVISIDGTHEMLTTGYSNPTPWNTERELTEDEMGDVLSQMKDEVSDLQNSIAVIHPPPVDSGLDMCPAIDDEFRIQSEGGVVTMAPVGSTAVREFIEETQPLLGLHGHVHEGKGTVVIGQTLCLNPGSEYSDGVLSGALVAVGDGSILSHQFVAG